MYALYKILCILKEQILETGAKDRLARLALVKKEKARAVEDALISAATNGKLQGKTLPDHKMYSNFE